MSCRNIRFWSGRNSARAEACKIMWVTLLKDTAVQELFFRPMHHKCTACPKTFLCPPYCIILKWRLRNLSVWYILHRVRPSRSSRQRNQAVQAEESRILFQPAGVDSSSVLCRAGDREPGAGLNSLICSAPFPPLAHPPEDQTWALNTDVKRKDLRHLTNDTWTVKGPREGSTSSVRDIIYHPKLCTCGQCSNVNCCGFWNVRLRKILFQWLWSMTVYQHFELPAELWCCCCNSERWNPVWVSGLCYLSLFQILL